jgi:ubiquinone/menaquinone biosynthesis C-methylase UbiE
VSNILGSSKNKNVFSTPEPWSLVSTGYEQTTMKFLSQYSESAIKLSNINTDSDILDMACGPGTLSRLLYRKVKSIIALDFSLQMVNLLDNYIQYEKIRNIKTVLGDGQKLLFEDNAFDAVFSMFGLMFFPNRIRGFSESFRVLKPGGQLIVSSWAPVDQSPAMKLMFEAMREAKPDLPKPEKAIDSLESKETFEKEMKQAGFSNINIHLITHSIKAESSKSFWNDMVKGSAPIDMLKNNTDEKKWIKMERLAINYIEKSISGFNCISGRNYRWCNYFKFDTSMRFLSGSLK